MRRIVTVVLLAFLSIAVCSAQHSDLRAYGLKGKVKRIATNEQDGVAFDKNGKIFSIRTASVMLDVKTMYAKKIHHDKKGRISRVEYGPEFQGASPTSVTYKYAANGNLLSTELSGHEWWNNYEYSNYKNGLPATVKLDCGGEAHGEEATCKITYTKFDKQGNWTECKWTGTLKVTDDGGETYHNEKFNKTITREIFYY